MSPGEPALKVYFDGSCPLCRVEVTHYRSQKGASQLCFIDVSHSSASIEADLTIENAMARFHVRRSDGQLVSGAAAFVSVWQELPGWRRAARATEFPGMMLLLESVYCLFLLIRPAVAWVFKMLGAKKRRQ